MTKEQLLKEAFVAGYKAGLKENYLDENKKADPWLSFNGKQSGVTVVCKKLGIEKEELKTATIPDTVTKINDWAFVTCKSLKSITIPDSVTEIGKGAFSDCESLASIDLPKITKIKEFTFQNCSSLKNLIIPDGVTEIGDGAFNHCDTLRSITIPDSVTKLGGYIFSRCKSLNKIYINSSYKNESVINELKNYANIYDKDTNKILYKKAGSKLKEGLYSIVYDYCGEDGNEEYNIEETFEGDWSELQDYIKQMKENGCYNIDATALDQNLEEDYLYEDEDDGLINPDGSLRGWII